ncbi:hypothetical protein OIU77_007049 [Salix suchowensis]|uniref:Secreted protein n=1 Tax=Salix suchowensis TaxID=1278906 RepID=A0ABQ9AMS3_9ROSI|nr:hypothetical protein OIU77_007049 [Salix suchowensis]
MERASIQISAFSICLNITAWEFMLCLGFLAACSVRFSVSTHRGGCGCWSTKYCCLHKHRLLLCDRGAGRSYPRICVSNASKGHMDWNDNWCCDAS